MESSGEKYYSIFKNPISSDSSNPFAANEPLIEDKPQQEINHVRRINGYDSAILNKTVYENSEEKDLRLDFRIRDKENLLKNLDEKIKMSEAYGNQNESLGLKAKRQRIAQELIDLRRNQAYNTRIQGELLRAKMPIVHKVTDFVSRNILSKVSKKVHSMVALNDSLEQLSQISKSVDELIDMNIPYGENLQNYQKLTEYLNRANKIHSNISKTLHGK